MERFPQRLRRLRAEAGLTQAQMAQRLKIERTTYLHMEHQDVAMLPERLESLARILGVPLDQLITGRASRSKTAHPVPDLK